MENSLLKRRASRGRQTSVRAVAVPWLRPGHTLLLQLPSGVSENVLVSSVTFDESGAMDVTTRTPDQSTIT